MSNVHQLSGMNIKAKKSEVLEILKTNRAAHTAIVQEARIGYIEKAKAVLLAKLNKLESNKVVLLVFQLSPPIDYTDVYDVAVRLLEMHTEDSISLTPQQVQNLILDKWDWTSDFYSTNSSYSKSASDNLEKLVGASNE